MCTSKQFRVSMFLHLISVNLVPQVCFRTSKTSQVAGADGLCSAKQILVSDASDAVHLGIGLVCANP